MPKYRIESEQPLMLENGMEYFPVHAAPRRCTAQAHIHDAIEIICVREGSFDITAGDRTYPTAAGELVLFRSGVLHSIHSRDQAENAYDVLKVRPSLLFDLASETKAAGYVLRFVITPENAKTHWTADELAAGGTAAAFDLLRRRADGEEPCKDIALKLAAAEIVLTLLRSIILYDPQPAADSGSDSATAQIYSVIRRVNRDYAEPLSARACAAEVNMSYSYFSRKWQQIVRKSFKEYLNEVRTNHARRLLKSTALPVTRIAMECGYNNVSYFISVYKELKGITPLGER